MLLHGFTREHAWPDCAVCPLCIKLGIQPIKHHQTFPGHSQLAKTISFRMRPPPGSGTASTSLLAYVQYMPISAQSGIFMHTTSFVVASTGSVTSSPNSVQHALSMPLARGRSLSNRMFPHPCHPIPTLQRSATCRLLQACCHGPVSPTLHQADPGQARSFVAAKDHQLSTETQLS